MAWPAAFGALLALSLLGCAEQLHFVNQGPSGGVSPYTFWPPPQGTSIWVGSDGVAEGEALSRVDATLLSDGYRERRWYPIGTGFEHGFAVTTRLERVEDGDVESAERWSALYPDASELRWLTLARSVALPQAGRYRVLLIAVTDLPIGPSSVAPLWNELTLMDGPGAPHLERPPTLPMQRVGSDYRVGLYVYEYDSDAPDRGQLRRASSPGEAPPRPSNLQRAFALGRAR